MTELEIDNLIARLPDLFFGRVGNGGYYPIGSNELVKTDRVADLDVGDFIDRNFNPISHIRISQFLGITLRQWLDIYFKRYI